MSEIKQFLKDHGITEVEAIVPDMAGVARGKVMPADKYAEDEGMRLPESIFLQTARASGSAASTSASSRTS